jgi:hypothetical protein
MELEWLSTTFGVTMVAAAFSLELCGTQEASNSLSNPGKCGIPDLGLPRIEKLK